MNSIRRLQKLLAYDAATNEWGNDRTGRRLFYKDFTTIGTVSLVICSVTQPRAPLHLAPLDWIHDLAKDRVRRKKLKTTNARGSLVLLWDASQAWILVSLVGE